MAKGKWKGLDLVRGDKAADESPKPQKVGRSTGLLRSDPKPKAPPPKRDPHSQLGRIRTRRVLRGADGEVYDLTERFPVWLVQIDDINQIFIVDALKSRGYDTIDCPRLDQLPAKLSDAEEAPKLIIVEARVVGQQTPFFRKGVMPRLQEANVPCLLTGLASAAQESSFRSWYDGPMLVGGDVEDLAQAVFDLIGAGDQR